MNDSVRQAFSKCLARARFFEGMTAPNPPVGAAALDRDGQILALRAHARAGEVHAEAAVLQELLEKNLLHSVHTLLVTLEPCNHVGRTPPCTEAILAHGIKHVIYGVRDPNPSVRGHGAERLRQAGVEVETFSDDDELRRECELLIAPFQKRFETGLPYVTVKTAHEADGGMIPPVGKKTFTRPESLRVAHLLRRRSDAILTGSGTVRADRPELTVRLVPDHLEIDQKPRWLIALDRRHQIPGEWWVAREKAGFRIAPQIAQYNDALEFLGKEGVLRVLVEAGPTLSQFILGGSYWDEHVVIKRRPPEVDPSDEITYVYRNH